MELHCVGKKNIFHNQLFLYCQAKLFRKDEIPFFTDVRKYLWAETLKQEPTPQMIWLRTVNC